MKHRSLYVDPDDLVSMTESSEMATRPASNVKELAGIGLWLLDETIDLTCFGRVVLTGSVRHRS